MQIPLYQQNIAPTTQSPAAMADPNAAAAPYKALGQLGETVSDIGFKFAQKLQGEETEAQTAQYMADRKLRANAMESTIATMTDPDEIAESYGKWREEENNILTETKLNGNSRRAIENNNENFYADTDIGANKYHRKAKIAGFDRTWIDVQNLAIDGHLDPDVLNPKTNLPFESADALYEHATMKRVALGTIKYEEAQDELRTMPSKRTYRTTLNELEVMEGQYLQNQITSDEYVDFLNKKQESLKADDTLIDEHQKPLDTQIESQKNNIYRKEGTKATTATKNWRVAMEKGTLDAPTNKILRETMGEDNYEVVISSLKESLAGKGTTDEDARDIVGIMDEYNAGTMSITEAFRDINAKGGDFAFQGILWLTEEVEKDVEGGKEIQGYEVWRRDQKVKTTGRMGDFLSNLMPTLTDDSTSEELNDLLYEAQTVINASPDMTKDEWNVARSEILKGNAQKVIKKLIVPQANRANPFSGFGGAVNKTSPKKTEWKEGDTRTHPVTGIEYTLKDGKWL